MIWRCDNYWGNGFACSYSGVLSCWNTYWLYPITSDIGTEHFFHFLPFASWCLIETLWYHTTKRFWLLDENLFIFGANNFRLSFHFLSIWARWSSLTFVGSTIPFTRPSLPWIARIEFSRQSTKRLPPSTLTYLRYCCNNWLACRRLLFVHRLLFFSSHRRWKSVPFSKNKKTTNNHEVCHSCIHSRGDSVDLLHRSIHSFTPPIKYSRVWTAEISK